MLPIDDRLHPIRFQHLMSLTEAKEQSDTTSPQFSGITREELFQRLGLFTTLFEVRQRWLDAGGDVIDIAALINHDGEPCPDCDGETPTYIHFGSDAGFRLEGMGSLFVDGVYLEPEGRSGILGNNLYYVCGGESICVEQMTLEQLLRTQTRIAVAFAAAGSNDIALLDGDAALFHGDRLDSINERMLDVLTLWRTAGQLLDAGPNDPRPSF